jgi:hypothetical protein
MNNTDFGEGNLIVFEEMFDELWIGQSENLVYLSHSNLNPNSASDSSLLRNEVWETSGVSL